MATTKRLCLIYEIQNFANTYLGKVTKLQGNGLFRFGVLSHLLGWRWKTPPVLIGLSLLEVYRQWHSFESFELFESSINWVWLSVTLPYLSLDSIGVNYIFLFFVHANYQTNFI